VADVAATTLRVRRPRPVSLFETWPGWFFYSPVPVWWFYLAARHGGLTLPTIANTAEPLSGFIGESKSAGLNLMGPAGRAHVAPFITFKIDRAGNVDDEEVRAIAAMRQADLFFPLIAKPDIGQNGAGVKIIRDAGSLMQWLAAYPCQTIVILQKLIEDEGEAGVFYVRHPKQSRGQILSLTLKHLPSVRGDGVSTLRELILEDHRARHFAPLYFARHANRLDRVLPEGKRLRLVSVGNHCRGAVFKNGAAHITPQMETAFDAIAREIPGFYFGRFDVKFKALGDLEQGRDFNILEINGADSEMTHIWDADETLMGAYATLYRQYRSVFEIGAYNRAQGTKPISTISFITQWNRRRKLLKKCRQEE
jgi:hypothetical protein